MCPPKKEVKDTHSFAEQREKAVNDTQARMHARTHSAYMLDSQGGVQVGGTEAICEKKQVRHRYKSYYVSEMLSLGDGRSMVSRYTFSSVTYQWYLQTTYYLSINTRQLSIQHAKHLNSEQQQYCSVNTYNSTEKYQTTLVPYVFFSYTKAVFNGRLKLSC